MTAHLTREHGDGERSWQRAVTEPRALYEHDQDQDEDEAESLGAGEAVIPDALLYYRSRGTGGADNSGDGGSMLRAFVEVDRATMGPERLAAKLGAYACLHQYVPTPPPGARHRLAGQEPARETGGGGTRCSRGCCSSWTAPDPPASTPGLRLCGPLPEDSDRPRYCATFPSWPHP
jgi:hypothetical protein